MKKFYVLEFVFVTGVPFIYSTIRTADEIDNAINLELPDTNFELDENGNRVTFRNGYVDYYRFDNSAEFGPSVVRKFEINIAETSGYMFLIEMRKLMLEFDDFVLPLVAGGMSRNEIVNELKRRVLLV